ncbi:DUF6308 family protein [Micromonospora sp. H33]|uniref:DUF6308 family protein n=1 Tax=Micromonospora sp. H33 TaxID=3452215 RepID=UPI003F8A1D9C
MPERQRQELIDAFAAEAYPPGAAGAGGPAGGDVEREVARSLADIFVDYCHGYIRPGLLAWSPGWVALFLGDWLPRKTFLGPVIASKLLARKRPRLVPVHDDVVLRVLAPPENQFWVTLAAALTESALRNEIEALRPTGIDSPSLLRLLDVAIWTRHSRSRNARNARSAIGVPEPGPLPPAKW